MNAQPNPRTKAAIAYVKRQRQQRDRLASWFDVSAAFDAGMRLALTNPPRAAEEFAELEGGNRDDGR